METCACPGCGAPAEVEVDDSYDLRPGDTVRVRCVARHWFLGPRTRLVPCADGDLGDLRSSRVRKPPAA